MKYNPEKKCITNDDGSLIKPNSRYCSGGHGSEAGNKYRCASINCMSGKKYQNWLVKELQATPGGMDGLYQVDGHRAVK